MLSVHTCAGHTHRKQVEGEGDDVLAGAAQPQVGCDLGDDAVEHHQVVLEPDALLQPRVDLWS